MARVLVPLAQGCEELEAITVIDLLRRAGIEVVTAGLDDRLVTASRGTVIMPDTNLDKVLSDEFDMIVLPGGLPGADNLNADGRVQEMIARQYSNGKWVAAICAAPKVLADAGLLANRRVTSFPGTLDGFNIAGMVYVDEPVVIDDNVVTSRGPGTAMDFTLQLIELLLGREQREEVEAPLQRP